MQLFGEGGIGIVQVSGARLCLSGSSISSPKDKRLAGAGNRSKLWMDLGWGGQSPVTVVSNAEPPQLSREDVVEINCHGIVPAKTLERVLEPVQLDQESLQEAFLHGRIDLSQAESN